VDQALDGGYDLVIGKARTGAIAQSSVFGTIAAKGQLVVLHPRPIEPENADMANMVMPAGVDAARDFDLERPNVMLRVDIAKQRRNLLRNRD